MKLPCSNAVERESSFRITVLLVACLNLAYFGIEFGVAVAIRSVSLYADSIDFLEDASINLFIAFALNWSAINRSRLGMTLAGIILVPSLAALWQAWQKFLTPLPPAAVPLSVIGAGALLVNFTCAFLLARYRSDQGSLTRAAFLSARNDVVANIAIIAAGVITACTFSAWPDLIVGLGIVAINADASRKVWNAPGKNSEKREPERLQTSWFDDRLARAQRGLAYIPEWVYTFRHETGPFAKCCRRASDHIPALCFT